MTTLNEKPSPVNLDTPKFWSKPIIRIIAQLAIFEFVFIVLFEILISYYTHSDHELIYYINIIIYSLIAVLCFLNVSLSKVNKEVPMIIGIWALIMTPYTSVFIFQSNFSEMFNFLNFHALYIFSITFRMFFTTYLFLFALNPLKSRNENVLSSITISIVVSSLIYLPIFISGEYRFSYVALFSRSYYAQIFNFSMLVIFWHQYTKSKIIFSEYLSNILSIWTVIIALEIFHYFSSQNELIFHYVVQYFYAVLYFIIIILLFARIIYLLNPSSKDNEKYIDNYFMLKGFIEKPRRGLFVEFYAGMNRSTLLTISILLFFLGVYLYFFDKFTVFIRLNILLLIIASIVSCLLAIITWHKRWYDAIGFFFKKTGK